MDAELLVTKFPRAPRRPLLVITTLTCLAVTCCTRAGSLQTEATLKRQPVELHVAVKVPFRFVAYGDTRFTDPSNTEASNAAVRRTLVQGIADAHPAFICIGGDISYNGRSEEHTSELQSPCNL